MLNSADLKLLKNEWLIYRLQPLLWLVILLALAFASMSTLLGNMQIAQASKQLLFSNTTLLMLVQPLVIGALAPLAFLREQRYGMSEIIGATPVDHHQWCISRAGALLISALTLQLAFLVLAGLGIKLQIFGNVDRSLWLFSMQLFFLQQLPALLLLIALQLWLSSRTRNPTLLYLLTAVVWLAYPLLAFATGSPLMANSRAISPVLSQWMLYLDPYGLSPWFAQLKRGESLHVDITLLMNRFIIVSLSVWIFWRALRAKTTLAGHSRQSAPPTAEKIRLRVSNSTATPMRVLLKFAPSLEWTWQRFAALVMLQLKLVLCQRSTILALIFLSGFVFSEVFTGLGYAEAMSRLTPNSRDALNRVNWDLLPTLGVLLIALWASQLSWLNRQTRCDGLIAATPVSGAVQVSSQLFTICLLTLILIGVSFAAVALAQLLLGSEIRFIEFLHQGLFVLLQFWFWGVLLLGCHGLMRTPLRANLVVAALLVFGYSSVPDTLGLRHPFWRIGQTQLQMPDSLWGFQGSAGADLCFWGGGFFDGGYWPYFFQWGLFAMSLMLLAIARYHRGTGQSTPRRWPLMLTLAAALCTVLTLFQGMSIHQQLRQAGALNDPQLRQVQRAGYERVYRHWRELPQPVVSHLHLQISLEPAAQKAQIQALLTITNPHQHAISQVLLGLLDERANIDIAFPGTQLKQLDTLLAQRIYRFDSPLQPGASTQIHLNMTLQQSALVPAQMHQVIRPTFTYLRVLDLLPQIGFVSERRLRNVQQRAQQHLAPLPAHETQPSVLAAKSTPSNARYEWAQIETIVSVPRGYQGIAAGTLLRQWQDEKLSYFHYQTQGAVRFIPAVLAVPWKPQRIDAEGIQMAIYSPDYNSATELTREAMQQTVRWFAHNMGAYPGDALRLIMMPDLGLTGYALPQLVLINDRVGLRAIQAPDAGFSQIYRRAAHEVAHQWFGHGIGNGVPGDGAFLVESLAKYVELVMLEQRFGAKAMQALVQFEQQNYSQGRARSRSVKRSLIDAEESYDQYSRATLVFAQLRAELGDKTITQALKQIWNQHRYPSTPASSMDFVRALKLLSPSAKHPLIETLLLKPDS